uniref:Sperm flagellar protein 1 n=1 Tax=Magallana gigas TaxID=29159 RepID=K1RCD4_MAGGI
MEEYFDDVELENLYQWIDRIPLTRPKKNIGKDFSDGVLLAEIVAHYFPKIVELHNYSPAAATKQKMENWYLLNRRVLRKLDLDLSDEVIRALANCKPKVVEKVLMLLRLQIDKNLQRQGRSRLEIDANFAQSMDTKETKKSQSAPAAENSPTTLHQGKPQNLNLGLLCIRSGSALHQLSVCSGSSLGPPSRLKVDREWTQKADLGFGLGLLSLRVCLVSTVGSRVKEA